MTDSSQPAVTKPAWYHTTPAVAISLLFCFPVGLILMWGGRVWSQTARIIVTVVVGLFVIGSIAGEKGASRSRPTTGQEATARPESAAVVAPPVQFIEESCSKLSRTFGTGSRLSDLQKEELWKGYEGKPFKWVLEITEVSSGTFGGYTVQAKCAQNSPSLIQDIQISYKSNAKRMVMQLEKGSAYELTGVLTNTSTLFGLGADGSP